MNTKDTPTKQCGLSTRSVNCLIDGHVPPLDTLGKVIDYLKESQEEERYTFRNILKRTPNLGNRSANEILAVIEPVMAQNDYDTEDAFIKWCLANREELEVLRREHL
jgi:hypothetical protein